MPYLRDRAWADKAMPDVEYVLWTACGWTIETASEHLDNHQATDVIANGKLHIAVRSRSIKYMAAYGDEFTIRSHRTSGTETELSKILKGFGDYLLYGFLEEAEHRHFRIIDLALLRSALASRDIDDISTRKDNRDGTYFRAFNVNSFGPLCPVVFKEGYC